MMFPKRRSMRTPSRSVFQTRNAPVRRPRRRPRYLAMEALEDRITPSFYGDLAQAAYTQLSSAQSGITNKLNAVDLPLIDGELGNQATVLSNQVLAALRNELAATPANPQASDIQSEVAFALGGLLGDTNGDGTAGQPTDVLVSGNLTSNVGIEVRLHQDLTVTSSNLNANLGLGSLPVQITGHGGVQLKVGFDCELAFGFDGTHFTIDTTRVLPSGHELDLGVDATLRNFGAKATLGFFTVTATDAGGTDFNATLHLDGLGGTPTVAVGGQADVNLHLAAGVGSNLDFPSMGADFQLTWSFDPNNPTADPPQARFNDVTLDLGQFVSEILGPILDDIQSATSSFEPIIKALTTPIPGISDISRFLGRGSVTLLDLATEAGGGEGFTELSNVVDSIGSFITEVDALHLTAGQAGVQLDLGSFDLGQQDLRNVASRTDLVPNVTKQIQTGGLSADAGDLVGKLSSNTANFGISFPIIDDPVTAGFRLILGQPATLVHFTADASLDMSSQNLDGLSVAGVGLNFDGDVSLTAHLGFGYDTTGLVEAISDAGSDPGKIPSDILDGFYLDAGTGPGATQIQLQGSIGPDLSFNFGIFSLSFAGDIDTGKDSDGNLLPIGLYLNDPSGAGQLRFGESEPCGLLHPYGKLQADLSFTISVGVTFLGDFIGYRQSFGLGSVTLLDLDDLNCCNVQPPPLELGVMDGNPKSAGQLDLILGGQTNVWENGAYQTETRVVPGHPEDSNNGIDENIDITHLWDDQGGGESILVSGFGVSQEFDGVTAIYADGSQDTAQNLTVNVEPGVESPTALTASGTKHAYLTYSGSGECYLTAGTSSSTLAGGSGMSNLYGGTGDDTLVAGSGPNLVVGGGGSNTIVVQAPNNHENHLYGGSEYGTEDPGADNILDVLSLPTSQDMSVQPDGLGSFRVTVGQSGKAPILSIGGGGFNSLSLGGAGGTDITIGDLSGTTLRQITAAVTPDIVPPSLNISRFPPPSAPAGGFYSQSAASLLDHGGNSGGSSGGQTAVSFFDPYTWTFLTDINNVYDNYDVLPQYSLDVPRGNTVTIDGSTTDPNSFSEWTTTGTVRLTHVSIGSLAVDIAHMGSDDALTLQGGGHGDSFYVIPDSGDRFAIVAEGGGPGSTLFVNGDYLPTGAADISDFQANGIANRVVFSWRLYAPLIGVVTGSSEVYFDDDSYALQVTGPTGVAGQPGETFDVNRSGGTTYIGGTEGDDMFDVTGSSVYTLNGSNGSDRYVIHWGLTGPQVTIQDNGTSGSDTLEVDDSGNSAGRSSYYQVTSDRILRTDDDVFSFDGFSYDLSFQSTISFYHMASVTLDTGHGAPVANQIDLYAMSAGTNLAVKTEDGVNQVDVIGTTSGTTTTITSGSGSDDVQVAGISETLDAIPGQVIVQGNGQTSVTVDDQYTAPSMGLIEYFFLGGQLDVIHEEYSGPFLVPTTAQIGYSGLANLTVDAVQLSPYGLLNVDSTAGTSLLVLNTGIIGTVVVGGTSGALDRIGAVVVNGGPGVALVIDDASSTGLPPDVPSDITSSQVSIAYRLAGGTVSRTAGWGYSTPDGGGGGASLADIAYNGVATLELDGSAVGAAYAVADTAVPATIKGGTGPDSFRVGDSLDGIDSLTIGGGGGQDTLQIDDTRGTGLPPGLPSGTSNVNSSISDTVTDQDVIRTASYGYSTADGGGGGSSSLDISYQSIAALTLDGGAAGDIHVDRTGIPTTINAGPGNATIDVGGQAGNLDGIASPLTIDGNGADTLNLDDRANEDRFNDSSALGPITIQTRPSYVVTDRSVVRSDALTITLLDTGEVLDETDVGTYHYDNVAALNLYGGSSGNSFDIQGTAPTTPLTVDAPINDEVTISSPGITLDDIQGPVLINGGGAVNLNIGDFHSIVGHTYTLTAASGFSTLARSGAAPITYTGTYAMQLVAGSGDDTFNLESIDDFTAVWGGGGNDTFLVSPVAHDLDNLPSTSHDISNLPSYLVLHGTGPGPTGGTADLIVDDQANAAGAAWSLTGSSLERVRPASPLPISTVIYFDSFQGIAVNAGPGNDAFTASNPLTTPAFAEAVTLDGGGGTNSLTVDDRAEAAAQTYAISSGSVTRTGAAPLGYSNFASLALYGGTGSNLFYVYSTAAGTTTDVYGGTNGGGADEFWPLLYDIRGPLNLHGQSAPGGESYALLYDYEDSAPGSYTLTAGTLDRSGMAPVTYDHLVEDIFYASALAVAGINLQGNAAGTVTYIVAGPGDPVTVGSLAPALGGTLADIAGTVVFSAGAPSRTSSITVDDSGDTASHPQASLGSYDANYNLQLSGLAPAQFLFNLDPATPINILGGRGDDAFTATGPLPTTALMIDGGGGINSLTFDDRKDTANATYTLGASAVGLLGTTSIGYAHIANLGVYMGTGSDVMSVYGTAAGTTTDVYGAAAPQTDEFAVANAPVTLDDIQGPLNLHGRNGLGTGIGGESYVVLNDSSTSSTGPYTLTAGGLSRPGIAPIRFDQMIAEVLYTSVHVPAAVDVVSNSANLTTQIALDDAGDRVVIGSNALGQGGTLAGIQGTVEVEGGLAASVVVDDSGDMAPHPQAALSDDPHAFGQPNDFKLVGLAPGDLHFVLPPTDPVAIRGGAGDDAFSVTDTLPSSALTIDGGGGNNTLVGPNTANTWSITGQNASTLNAISFTNIANLVGANTSDRFRFGAANVSIGSVRGGQGPATLDFSLLATPVAVHLGDGTNGTATDVAGTASGISAVIGGRSDDILDAGSVPGVALTGGPGTNRLSGAGAGDSVVESSDSAYTLSDALLTGTNTGFVDNLAGIRVASLTGIGAASNTFTVDGWTGTGSLSAPAGTGGVSATKNAGFTLTNTALTATDGLSLRLGGIVGASLTTTAASGSPSYVVDASAFTGVTNLTVAGTVNAILFGGAANGSTLKATGSGHCGLIGGVGNDTITDTGSGSNILIGDAGSNTLVGNGQDILIGGPTLYDKDTPASIAALDAILAEWTSNDPYATRIAKITAGVGPGGAWALNGSTCLVKRTADVLSDGTPAIKANWFIVEPSDKVTKKANETVTVA
jgi:hypothetical protein